MKFYVIQEIKHNLIQNKQNNSYKEKTESRMVYSNLMSLLITLNIYGLNILTERQVPSDCITKQHPTL